MYNARDIDNAELRRLYQECFDDSEELIDYLFTHKISKENAVVECIDGALAGALYMVPKRLRYYNHTVKVGFVMGVGVYPEYRGRRVATSAMRTALSALASIRIPFSILYPVDIGIYHGMGYRVVCSQPTVPPHAIRTACTADRALAFLETVGTYRDIFQFYSTQDMLTRLAEMASEGIAPQIAECEGAYYLVLDDAVISKALTPRLERMGHMARIASGMAAVELLPPDMPYSISLQDSLVAENNFSFIRLEGKTQLLPHGDVAVDVSELTAYLFGCADEAGPLRELTPSLNVGFVDLF